MPPIKSVIGVRRMTATAALAMYELVDSAYQPEGSRVYDEIDAEISPRWGSTAAMAIPIAAMSSSNTP